MKSVFALAFALALAACAAQPSTDASTATGASEEKEYRTGSHLPRRDPTAASAATTPVAPAPKM